MVQVHIYIIRFVSEAREKSGASFQNLMHYRPRFIGVSEFLWVRFSLSCFSETGFQVVLLQLLSVYWISIYPRYFDHFSQTVPPVIITALKSGCSMLEAQAVMAAWR